MIETLTTILTFIIIIIIAFCSFRRSDARQPQSLDEYFKSFLKAKGLDESLDYCGTCCFELDERTSDKLLDLVLKGKKKATCSSVKSFEADGEEIPKAGDYVILTDFKGTPRGVFQEIVVKRLLFKEMKWEDAFLEGEDDNFESWKASHTKFFDEEGKILNYSFDENLPIVFEIFQLVWPV